MDYRSLFLAEAPLFRPLMFWLIGTVLAFYLNPSLLICGSIFILFISFSAFVIMRSDHRILFKNRSVHSMIILICISSAGMWQIQWNRPENQHKSWFNNVKNKKCIYGARLLADPSGNDSMQKVRAEIFALNQNKVRLNTAGLVIIYFLKDPQSLLLRYGDELYFSRTPDSISDAKNPFAFDTRRYQYLHHVTHKLSLRKGEYKLVRSEGGNALMNILLKLRRKLAKSLEKDIKDPDALSVSKALLLGIISEMDPELMQAYSSTGVIHVLSVSGLHVGIFYLLIEWVLGKLKRNSKKITRLLRTCLTLSLVWAYAGITGFSPSVLRSAVMLSFIIIGKNASRDISIYNSIFASLLVLLIYDPFLIFDNGFLLSYLAVLGLVYFQPKIKCKLSFPYKWQVEILNMISGSIAAQIMTLPLVLYNFRQFPTVFLISNIAAIPLATLSLPVGLISLPLCGFLPVKWAFYIMRPLEYLLIALNAVIRFCSEIPGHNIKGIAINETECGLLFIILASIILITEFRNRFSMFLLLSVTALFLLSLNWRRWQNLHRSELWIYQRSGHTVIHIICGKKSLMFSDQIDANFRKWKMMQTLTHHDRKGVSTCSNVCIPKKNMLITWNDLKILYLCKRVKILPETKPDFLYLAKNVRIPFNEIKKKYPSSTLICDASNKFANVNLYGDSANHVSIPFLECRKGPAILLKP